MTIATASTGAVQPRSADEKVLVLDFGSQYAQLIARRVREQHVYCEIVRHDITAERIRELAPTGHHPLRRAGQRLRAGRPEVRSGDLPAGHARAGHLLRDAAGLRGAGRPGARARRPASTAGPAVASRRTTTCSPACPSEIEVWMSHGDQVSPVSADFVPLAATDTCPIAAVKHAQLPIYGLQFHPEVTHTPLGAQMLAQLPHARSAAAAAPGSWAISPERPSPRFAGAWATAA